MVIETEARAAAEEAGIDPRELVAKEREARRNVTARRYIERRQGHKGHVLPGDDRTTVGVETAAVTAGREGQGRR